VEAGQAGSLCYIAFRRVALLAIRGDWQMRPAPALPRPTDPAIKRPSVRRIERVVVRALPRIRNRFDRGGIGFVG
jgi:hypothetical protein